MVGVHWIQLYRSQGFDPVANPYIFPFPGASLQLTVQLSVMGEQSLKAGSALNKKAAGANNNLSKISNFEEKRQNGIAGSLCKFLFNSIEGTKNISDLIVLGRFRF